MSVSLSVRNWLIVLPQALDITNHGVFGHFLRFFQSAAVRHAARESGNHRGEPALGFRPQNDIEMTVLFRHGVADCSGVIDLSSICGLTDQLLLVGSAK